MLCCNGTNAVPIPRNDFVFRVAIIVSGNSTKREYIQLLGRILRPKAGEALLYELVTTGTTEEDIAMCRLLASWN